MLRVLALLEHLNPGGIQSLLLSTIPRLRQRDIAVDIGRFQLGEQAWEKRFLKMGCQFWTIPKRLLPGSAGKALARWLHERKYDLIHSHYGYTGGAHVEAANRVGLPCIVSVHNLQPGRLADPSLNLLQRKGAQFLLKQHRARLQLATRITGASSAALDRFQADWRQHPEKFVLLPNGVEPPVRGDKAAARRFLNLPPDAFVLVHVGTFRPEKNHAALIETVQGLRAGDPTVHAVCVGDGPRLAAAKTQATAAGLGKAMQFPGTKDEPSVYLAAADAFISPSTAEGLGNAVIEAQLAELPVVASGIPAHEESVAPVWHDLFFDPFDVEGAVASVQRLRQLPPAERLRRTVEARGYAAHTFNPEVYVNRLAEIYRQAVGQEG